MNTDLRIIKDKYGEKMMHLCRELFPTLLEQEGLLSNLLLSKFNESHFLYDDIINNNYIEEFKNYIYSFVDVEKPKIEVNKTPQELLSEVGYDLYECKTEDDIQRFKKYYAPGETICTIYNKGRLQNCYVFFAVKKNVNDIKRENFSNPKRQDEYGTSVLSIQFYKGKQNNVSIKNRYNHTVNNPDAAFSNNLNNIISGLTEAFAKEYNLNITSEERNNFELSNYVKANNGKFYKYNYELNNIYYCPDNIIIANGEARRLNKQKNILIDYFVIDLENKKIQIFDNRIGDSFIDGFSDIKKIKITKIDNNKRITITPEQGQEITIEIDILGNIIKYYNPNLEEIKNHFLCYNRKLAKLSLLNLKRVGDNFLRNNLSLTKLNLPNLEYIEDNFLWSNRVLDELNLPSLKAVENKFLCSNRNLKELNLPNLNYIKNDFLLFNKELSIVNLPKLNSIGDGFLTNNIPLTKLNLPNLKKVGGAFLYFNIELKTISLPKLKHIRDEFLYYNTKLVELVLPSLITVGMGFLANNQELTELNLPCLEETQITFLCRNQKLKIVNLPNLEYTEGDFLKDHPNKEKLLKTIEATKRKSL